jgi:hypothetical protein
MSGFFSNLLALANTWQQTQTYATGKQIIFDATSANGGGVGSIQVSLAANAAYALAISSGIVHLRDDTAGGSALIDFDGTAPAIVYNAIGIFTVVDPGAGANKWWVAAGGTITNRFPGTRALSIAFLSGRSGRLA